MEHALAQALQAADAEVARGRALVRVRLADPGGTCVSEAA